MNYSKKPYYQKSSLPTKFEDQFYYISKYFKLEKLKKDLENNTTKPDLKKNYIVFYGSISPEKSQIPDAENFHDTYKVLRSIKKNFAFGLVNILKSTFTIFSMQFETHLAKNKLLFKFEQDTKFVYCGFEF